MRKPSQQDSRASLETAVARLLDLTDHPTIAKWVQSSKALSVSRVLPGNPESGAFYVLDRRRTVCYWVDFEDENFEGYTLRDLDQLVRECRSLDIVQRPHLLQSPNGRVVQPGLRPCQDCAVASSGAVCK